MLDRQRGVIVNMASVGALVGLRDRDRPLREQGRGRRVHEAGRDAVRRARSEVRRDLPVHDRHALGRPAPRRGARPASRRDELVARQPLGRLGNAAEIAKAVLYVASDDAAFMTGSELMIDGGITAT